MSNNDLTISWKIICKGLFNNTITNLHLRQTFFFWFNEETKLRADVLGKQGLLYTAA